MNFRLYLSNIFVISPPPFDDQKLYDPPSRTTMLKKHVTPNARSAENMHFKKQVKFLYDRWIKLYFSAGKWRDRNGNLASFYNANTPGLIIEDAASQAGNASQRGRLANQREIDVEIHPHPEEEEEEVSE